jgi:ABC-2 type transport system ATP-binding protein
VNAQRHLGGRALGDGAVADHTASATTGSVDAPGPPVHGAEETLAAGRRHLACHYAALARGAPDPRHARAAVRALRRAVRDGDRDGRARATLAEAAVACCAGTGFLLRAQMIATARRAAREALDRDPTLGEAHAALGILCLHTPISRTDRGTRARAHLDRAVRAQPARADWRAWLARACHEAGDATASRREIDVLRRSLPAGAAAALITSVFGGAPPEDALEPPLPRSDAPRSSANGAPAIEARGARRGFPGRAVLRGVDLEVGRGEVVALVGANGAGKSTLLGAIAGRIALEAGHLSVLGARVVAGRLPAGLGHAPQSVGLYPLLTVREHLACFARLHGLRGAALGEAVDDALAWSGLVERAADLTRILSGGMRRRLAIALAAIHDPAALLLDEPMTGIDAVHRQRIWRMLRERARRGTAILCAAPHLDDVSAWTDRVVELVAGEIARRGPALPTNDLASASDAGHECGGAGPALGRTP